MAWVEKSWKVGGDVLDLCRAARLGRVERPRADQGEARRGRPAHLDDHRVAECGTDADELVAFEAQVGEVPVEPGVEPGGEPCGDVGGQHRGREEHVRRAALADDRFERVDARLRQRRRERLVVDDVDRRRAVGAGLGGGVADAAPEHDAGDVAAEREAFASTPRPPLVSSPSCASR